MGILLHLRPSADLQPPPRHQRLRRRSRVLAALFSGLFWSIAAGVAAMALMDLFYQGRSVAFGPEGGLVTFPKPVDPLPTGYLWWSDVSLPYRLGGLFALVTQYGPAVMVMYHLRGLFRLYARGIVFAEENAHAFKRMGQWLIAYAVTPFLSVKMLTLLDLVIDRAWFHNAELYALGLGVILFIVAEVMEAGREIEQERDEFV
jgi:hypothetical protein